MGVALEEEEEEVVVVLEFGSGSSAYETLYCCVVSQTYVSMLSLQTSVTHPPGAPQVNCSFVLLGHGKILAHVSETSAVVVSRELQLGFIDYGSHERLEQRLGQLLGGQSWSEQAPRYAMFKWAS